MPRGSKPGERRGGRQRGTPNKKTALKNAALAAAAANTDISPRDFLLGIMRDPTTSSDLRVKIALVVVRLTHAKPAIARRHDPTQSGELIDCTGSLIDAIEYRRRLNAPADIVGNARSTTDPGIS